MSTPSAKEPDGPRPARNRWSALSPDLMLRVAARLPPNEVTCALRFLDRSSMAVFSAPRHRTVYMSQPVPSHAKAKAKFAQHWCPPGAARGLTYKKRCKLLCIAAGNSDSATNLAAVLEATGLCALHLRVYEAAARGGCLESCQLLWEKVQCMVNVKQRDMAAMRVAQSRGHDHICAWLHEQHGVPLPDPPSHRDVAAAQMMDAASGGQVETCIRLHEEYGFPYTEAVMAAAAGKGDLSSCGLLWRAGCPCNRSVFKAAAHGGHRAVCAWLLDSGAVSHLDAAAAAAEAGEAQLVTELLDNKAAYASIPVKWWNFVLPAAAEGCDLRSLQALFERAAGEAPSTSATGSGAADSTGGADVGSGRANPIRMFPNVRSLILAAAINGPTDDWQAKAEWLLTMAGFHDAWEKMRDRIEFKRSCKHQECLTASLARLAWLRGKGFITQDVLKRGTLSLLGSAKLGGDVAAMQLLIEAGEEAVREDICGEVMNACSWEEALLLQSRGCRITGRDLAALVRKLGSDEMEAAMEALLERLGPELVLGHEVTAAAAEAGNVPLLAWLHDRGCSLNEEVVKAAFRGGCEEALEWLAERGCKLRARVSDYILFAARVGDMLILKCLHRLGCPIGPDTFLKACRSSSLAVMKWMLEHGHQVDRKRAMEAARKGANEVVVAWLASMARNREQPQQQATS